MSYALETTYREGEGVSKGVSFASFLAIIAGANTAFIFGLVAMLSWRACLMVALAAAALAGGGVFTVLEMHRLGKEGQ